MGLEGTRPMEGGVSFFCFDAVNRVRKLRGLGLKEIEIERRANAVVMRGEFFWRRGRLISDCCC